MTNKYCVVPLCQSTTKSTPEKLFISVPRNEDIRKKWMLAIRRKNAVSTKSNVHCCGDHFKPEDIVNLKGGKKRVKEGVLPHIFKCQNRGMPTKNRVSARNKTMVIEEKSSGGTANSDSCAIPTTHQDANSNDVTTHHEDHGNNGTVQRSQYPTRIVHFRSVMTQATGEDIDRAMFIHLNNIQPELMSAENCPPQVLTAPKITAASSYQTKSLGFSPSKSLWTVTSSADQNSLTERPVLKINDVCVEELSETTSVCSNDDDQDDSDTSYCPSEESREEDDEDTLAFQRLSLSRTRKLISMQPRRYIGVPEDRLSIIPLLAYKVTEIQSGKVSAEDVIYLILRKIRLNESFTILGNEFGVSGSYAGKLFTKYISFIADHFKELVYWPKSETVKKNLPIAFRKNFSGVESIIDCLETAIEKPSKSMDQALTWSDYKSANTVKFLISVTPSGFVNYISEGYGGRISDELITSVCGYLDELPSGICVMADRGFKSIEPMIVEKKCVLVRPCSVSSGGKLAKNDVIQSRKIAALRIHVERLIRRVREFLLLSPHACINMNLIKHVDDAMSIACGLVNLQPPLIK